MAESSQKFIARNRAPRVQIEYDVEVYGAEKKIQLPFVMGVMADLSGKPTEPLAPVAGKRIPTATDREAALTGRRVLLFQRTLDIQVAYLDFLKQDISGRANVFSGPTCLFPGGFEVPA